MSAGSWLYHQYTHPYLAERHEGKEGLAADNESTAGEPGNLYHLDLLIVHKNKGMHKGRQDVSRKFLKTRVGGCVHATLLTPLEWDYRLSLRLRLSSLTTHSTSISIHVPMDRWAVGTRTHKISSHYSPTQSTMLLSRTNPRLQLHSTDPWVSIHTCWHPPLLVPQSSVENIIFSTYFFSSWLCFMQNTHCGYKIDLLVDCLRLLNAATDTKLQKDTMSQPRIASMIRSFIAKGAMHVIWHSAIVMRRTTPTLGVQRSLVPRQATPRFYQRTWGIRQLCTAESSGLGHEQIPKVDSSSARGLVYFISERSHMSPDPMLRDYKSWLRYVHGSSRLSVSPCLWRRWGVSGRPMQVRCCTVCTLFNIHLSHCILFRNPFLSPCRCREDRCQLYCCFTIDHSEAKEWTWGQIWFSLVWPFTRRGEGRTSYVLSKCVKEQQNHSSYCQQI